MRLDERIDLVAKEVRERGRSLSRFTSLELRYESKESLPDPAAPNQPRRYLVDVSLEGPADVLEDVRYVEYLLHPTFTPNKVRRADGPHFPLRLKLWGEFTLRAEVTFDEGPPVSLARYLRL